LTLTTNGSLLARKAQALKDAGLQRLTVSLDGLDDAVFRRMNDVDFPVADVLAGLDAAQAVGFKKIKVKKLFNCHYPKYRKAYCALQN
jgi:cyclic pyranopterin phosphate synthase